MANVTHGGRSQVPKPLMKDAGYTREFLESKTVKVLSALTDHWGVNPKESGKGRRVLKEDFITALLGK